MVNIEDFVILFGKEEAMELAYSSDEEGNIDSVKMLKALTLANNLIEGYKVEATLSGKQAIDAVADFLQLHITRYLLDTLKRREDVQKSYDFCIKYMERYSKDTPKFSTKVSYEGGRRAFTDDELSEYRQSRLW